MKRIMNLAEETDGRLYKSSDTVSLGCDGCNGEADCCRYTDDTIILDPYDFFELETAVGCTFRDGYGKLFELRVVDGITLPYLLKSKETEDCILLSGGRCRIHAHRPGFCRLFPLGRMYNETGFDYFLQTGQCRCGKTKPVTVREWLGIPDLEEYEKYIQSWHDLTEKCQKDAMQAATSGESRKAANAEYILGISMKLLNAFFIPPYDTNASFYEQYYKRLNALDQK